MKVNFNLINGGYITYNKKDKQGNKTDEKATMYTLLEADKEKGVVNAKQYILAGDNPLNLNAELLTPVVATIDISATSNFQTLCEIKAGK